MTCGLATVRLNGHVACLHIVKHFRLTRRLSHLNVHFASLSVHLGRIMTRRKLPTIYSLAFKITLGLANESL